MGASGPDRVAKKTRTDWETPDELFRYVNYDYGPFTVDGAANEVNHKCDRWFGPGGECEDAFNASPRDETIWLNPPYGNLGRWAELVLKWVKDDNDVVVLVPNATDTKWFRSLAERADSVMMITGRIPFKGTTSSNTTGSCVMFLGGWSPAETLYDFESWSEIKNFVPAKMPWSDPYEEKRY